MTDSTRPHDLHLFMDQITVEMASEYSRIYTKASEDPGTAGDEGEENWASLFRDWLPQTYNVQTKGRLVSARGEASPQVDVVVLKPSYPRKLLGKRVWLADGVAAAFECKTTIKAEHVKSASEKSQRFKSLVQERSGTPRDELCSSLIFGLLGHSHSWKRPGSKAAEKVGDLLFKGSLEVEHPKLEIDLLCIADLACWSRGYVTRWEANGPPELQEATRNIYGSSVGPQTGYFCSEINGERQSENFKPVGSLIAYLNRLMAWEDETIRPIADYYRLTGLLGQGFTKQRPWPIESYSEQVRKQIELGRFSNNLLWDKWSLGPF